MKHEVLVPLDGSVLSEAALPHAIRMAQASQSQVHLLRVVLPPIVSSPLAWSVPVAIDSERIIEAEKTVARRYLDMIQTKLNALGVETIVSIEEGDPATCILELAEKNPQVGSLVMASQGHSRLHRWTLGSVAQRVLHNTPVPLMIVPSDATEPLELDAPVVGYERIMVPLDGSRFAEQALGMARTLSDYSKATVHLFSVVPFMDSRELAESGIVPMWTVNEQQSIRRRVTTYLDDTALYLTRAGLHVQTSTLEGYPAEAIVAAAETANIDLVIMSTHGRSGLSRLWLGSVAIGVIHHSRVPVLLIRAQEEQHERAA